MSELDEQSWPESAKSVRSRSSASSTRRGVSAISICCTHRGVIGGDQLEIELDVAPGAQALITTPGAAKFYRSLGTMAIAQQRLKVAGGGQLEWFPQEILDHWGIVKADVGIKDGRIAGIGKAGNPDTQVGVDILVGPGTEAIAGEGQILTAGAIDAHIHFIHTYHTEGAGGGHAPDIIKACGLPDVLPSFSEPSVFDPTLVTARQRLRCTEVATADRRDFSAYRPAHVERLANPISLSEPAHLAPILQDDPIPGIAIAEQIQPGLEDASTQLQHPLPKPGLYLMGRAPFLVRLLDEHQDLRKLLCQRLTLDLTRRLVHASHRGLLGLWT